MTMAAKDERLYWAAQSGDDKQIQLLVDQGADLEYTNYWGQSAAHQASIYGYLRVLQCLIKAGININETDSGGWNCAHFASANGHVDVMKYLIQLGINLHGTNNKGDNCLHLACYWGYLEVIKLLQGRSLESPPNKEGKPPLDYLKEKSKYDDNVTKRRQECLKALKVVIKDTVDTESIRRAEGKRSRGEKSDHSTLESPVETTEESIRRAEGKRSRGKKKAVELKKKKIENRMSEPNFQRAQGIIFIIGIYGADGTAKDVENVESTFKELNFSFYTERDPTAAEIDILIKATAQCAYPYRYRYVAFYYAGHGGSDDSGRLFITPLQQDELKPEVLYIEEYIIEPLNCLKDRDLTRMFFFDCCQSQGKGTAYCARDSSQIVKRPRQHPGMLIAYATSDGQKSFGDRTNGGIWTYHLCKNLKKELPLVTILAETFDEIVHMRKDFQEPMTVARIGALQLKQPKAQSNSSTNALEKVQIQSNLPSQHTANASSLTPGQSSSADGKESILKKPPEPIDVHRLLSIKAVYWNKIGLKLGIRPSYREELERSIALDCEEKLEKILVKWTECQCSDVTWETVLDALKKLEFMDIVQEVNTFLERSDVITKYCEYKDFRRT